VNSTNDEGFREIQLNGKQLVFLVMAATVVSVMIFLCGVMVGRDVRPDRAAAQEVAAGVAPDPGATPAPAAAPATPLVTEPPAPPDELTAPERLQAEKPVEEELKTAPPPKTEPVAQRPTPVAAATPKNGPSPTVRAPAAANPSEAAPNPTGPGFAVQVAAYADRREADTLAKQLLSKGYPAFVMDPVKGGPKAMYRVRVGKYKTYKDAQSVSTRLETSEQFKPWIAR
jgi:cell division septation protein DedD